MTGVAHYVLTLCVDFTLKEIQKNANDHGIHSFYHIHISQTLPVNAILKGPPKSLAEAPGENDPLRVHGAIL